MLRRMMNLGLDYGIILDIYFKEIRSVLEYGAVIFHSGLTNKQSDDIEQIQKLVLRLVSHYIGVKFSYTEACIYFSAEPLFSRRLVQCEKFIKHNSKSEKSLFHLNSHKHDTRPNKFKYKEYKCNTVRYYNSPLVFFKRLANSLS